MTDIKICAGASAGGHMNQLLRLLDCSELKIQPSFYLTTQQELVAKLAKRGGDVYVLGECNRRKPVSALRVIYISYKVIRKEKPDAILTTGSMPIAIFCAIAKLFSIKIIWVDSIANTKRFSLSGRFVYFFADLFLTQWPELAEQKSNAEYVGSIL